MPRLIFFSKYFIEKDNAPAQELLSNCTIPNLVFTSGEAINVTDSCQGTTKFLFYNKRLFLLLLFFSSKHCKITAQNDFFISDQIWMKSFQNFLNISFEKSWLCITNAVWMDPWGLLSWKQIILRQLLSFSGHIRSLYSPQCHMSAEIWF